MSYNFLHLVAVLVMVCVFFHWTEVFPCSQATPFFFLVKVLLGKNIPIWKTLLAVHSDQGTCFTGEEPQQVCSVWPVVQHRSCSYTLSALVYLTVLMVPS